FRHRRWAFPVDSQDFSLGLPSCRTRLPVALAVAVLFVGCRSFGLKRLHAHNSRLRGVNLKLDGFALFSGLHLLEAGATNFLRFIYHLHAHYPLRPAVQRAAAAGALRDRTLLQFVHVVNDTDSATDLALNPPAGFDQWPYLFSLVLIDGVDTAKHVQKDDLQLPLPNGGDKFLHLAFVVQ